MNNNKRIIARISRSVKMLLLGSVVAMTSSCDDFLTIYPTDKIVYEDFWKTKEDVENVVAESYRLLSSGNVINRIIVWGEARADNVIEGNYSGNKDVEYVMEANILPSNQYASWAPFYNVINNCNQVLKYAPMVLKEDPDFTQGDCNVVMGEMYALRALSHFYLVRTFRDIPLLMEAKVDDSQELYQLQVDPIVALDSCIVDLKRAESLVLETGGYTIINNGNNKNVGRITKDAVRTMLADVYLWKGAFLEYAAKGADNAGAQCYDECISYCDRVLSDRMIYADKYLKEENNRRIELHKKFPLVYMPAKSSIYEFGEVTRFPHLPYTMTFGGGASGCNNPIESIFELQHDTEKDNGNREVPTFYGYAKNNDSPTEFQYGLFAAPSHLTQSLYKDIDYRKVYYLYLPGETDASDKTCIIKYSNEITEGKATNGFGTPKYRYTKTTNEGGRFLSENQVNWIVYRISDVMLMKAEALVAKGGSSDEVKEILWAIYNRSQLAYKDGETVVGPVDGNAASKYATAVLSNGDLTDVLNERQRELAYEAKRWYDVVRVSLREASVENPVFQEMLNNKYASKGSASQYAARLSTIDHLFFPIAEREMNIHPGLKQNEAYKTVEDIQ